MVARFEPDGEQQQTASPQLELRDGMVQISSMTEGASLGYRVDEADWQLYTGPFKTPAGASIEAKAVRYGWEESDSATIKNH